MAVPLLPLQLPPPPPLQVQQVLHHPTAACMDHPWTHWRWHRHGPSLPKLLLSCWPVPPLQLAVELELELELVLELEPVCH